MGGTASRVVRRNRKALLFLCLVGFAVRLVFLILFDPGIVFSDQEFYWGQAKNLSDHGTLHYNDRDAICMPLTAIVIASFVMLTGSGIFGAKLLFVVSSAITVYFIMRIALLFHPSRSTLWIAGIAAAFYPFFIFYSRFGFQRVGDLIWAAGDSRCRGFLIGGTFGRTTLNGEGLQHQDGHSHVLASTHPRVVAYDPAYAYEMALIVGEGIRRMAVGGEDLIYYISAYNEPYPQPAMPPEAEPGIL